jgi:hypothetical protein
MTPKVYVIPPGPGASPKYGEGASMALLVTGKQVLADHPPLGDFRGVIHRAALNRLYSPEITAETMATKSGTVPFRISRS